LAIGGGALAAWALGCLGDRGDAAALTALRATPEALRVMFDVARARPGRAITLSAAWEGGHALPQDVSLPVALCLGRFGERARPDAKVIARVVLPLRDAVGSTQGVVPWLTPDAEMLADEGYSLTPFVPLTGTFGERLDVVVSPFAMGG
jgi:hypothetical protein